MKLTKKEENECSCAGNIGLLRYHVKSKVAISALVVLVQASLEIAQPLEYLIRGTSLVLIFTLLPNQ